MVIKILDRNQLDRLSEYCSNLSLVFLASVISPIFSGTERTEIFNTIIGLILMILSLIASIFLARRRK